MSEGIQLKRCLRATKLMGICLVFSLLPHTALSEPHEARTYLGVASCSSSNCHGSMSPRNATAVLQNEYITWLKKDSHAQAWKTLLSNESKRIGWHLGIENPSQDKTCLQCHATYSSKTSDYGEKFRLEDGVGCESCHGAASSWITDHAAAHTTHDNNLSRGLTKLEDPSVRAKNCLSCHQGDETRELTHQIYGAGHPRLSFELDTYSALQPYHWLEDKDYNQRKGAPPPLALWYAGQIAAAKGQVALIKKMVTAAPMTFPEFSAFNCYSCHHSLDSEAYLKYDYRKKPGHPPINLSAIEMIEIALTSLQKSDGKRINEIRSALTAQRTPSESTQLINELENILVRNEKITDFSAKHGELLRQLVTYAGDNESLYFETAEQIAMAIESIEASRSPGGKRSAKLDKILASLSSPRGYNPQQFSALCRQYF